MTTKKKWKPAETTRAEALQIFCSAIGGVAANPEFCTLTAEQLIGHAYQIAREAIENEDIFTENQSVRDHEAELDNLEQGGE
jgi:hypothetical protein